MLVPTYMYDLCIIIGTLELIRGHPNLLDNCTVEELGCKKDTGEKSKLRKWSRGHQFIVRAGGHIDDWQPLFKLVRCNQTLYNI